MTHVDPDRDKPHSFTLTMIADWQLSKNESKVELPTLQRGFVWKPGQVEEIWDSLLRGFPIGTFLLSKEKSGSLFLLDGQQRATSIAIGFYNPWKTTDTSSVFWTLRDIPVMWIDLDPKLKPLSHRFSLRVVTASHPWGYQALNNGEKISLADRRKALALFRKNPSNKNTPYTKLSRSDVFPYDAHVPIPLSFLIEAIRGHGTQWKEVLLNMCASYLPIQFISTKYSEGNYLDMVARAVESDHFKKKLYPAVEYLPLLEIPGITVRQEVLKEDDEEDVQLNSQDPTLFVRLNSSGTRIGGEELIYSIYKAAFPAAKTLVEKIGLSYIQPSLVITLIARLVISETKNEHPNPISVHEFRKLIRDEKFRLGMQAYIGDDRCSIGKNIFSKAINILLAASTIQMPALIVKNFIRSSQELFLLLLKWISVDHLRDYSSTEEHRILSALMALSYFGPDNKKYVRAVWVHIDRKDFWTKSVLNLPYVNKENPLMVPLIHPDKLRRYLIDAVVNRGTEWHMLYPEQTDSIMLEYGKILPESIRNIPEETTRTTQSLWSNFIEKLHRNRYLLLFAQREYICKEFSEYDQMENLEDTNVPWDWDHIYPDNWVYYQQGVNPNTRHWNSCIGNFRALSIEDNRSQQDSLSPKARLNPCRKESFILDNDWAFWSQIESKINIQEKQEVNNHLCAVIHRLCNIYGEWYTTLEIETLFSHNH